MNATVSHARLSMIVLRVAACFGLVCATLRGVAAEPAGRLASPMVDPGIFQADQVRRLTGHFGQWTMVCDEVKALGRRYCSLRSAVARDGSGRGVYADVSTGDDGRPAALLHLPLGIAVRGIRIATIALATGEKPRAGKAPTTMLPIVSCSGSECLAVWTPRPGDVAALNRNAAIRVSYCSLRPAPLEFKPSLAAGACDVWSTVALPGAGFTEAVLASVGGPS